jgi:plastocyanin
VHSGAVCCRRHPRSSPVHDAFGALYRLLRRRAACRQCLWRGSGRDTGTLGGRAFRSCVSRHRRGALRPSGEVIELTAQSHTFDQTTLSVPADQAFHIVFTNAELLTKHNLEIEDGDRNEVFFGKVFDGEATMTYDVPALAAGTYRFLCTVHPEMEDARR